MPAIPDIISVVGSSYYQPIADLVDRLLVAVARRPPESGVSHSENGYSAACVVLLVALMESFTARVRFKRQSELAGGQSTPDLLARLFPALPTKDDLQEVYLLRNIVVHNHLWHLDISNEEAPEPQTIALPTDLGFSVNKNYSALVDTVARRTVKLGLKAVPTWVGVTDVSTVFRVIWSTLEHMHGINFDHTPLAGRRVQFRGSMHDFESLQTHLAAASAA